MDTSVGCLFYLIDVVARLLSGRLVWEQIGPAMLSAVQSQNNNYGMFSPSLLKNTRMEIIINFIFSTHSSTPCLYHNFFPLFDLSFLLEVMGNKNFLLFVRCILLKTTGIS